ncbi:MarR family winged helix-turn-helix transcriptional regulator [Jatrophihabitans endophyticus]|uniref:MarR family winged helix-turn-helix transcriptional regulator n=1 Tax=Jatrophihabitans endophyticus TaxID=1206085 RepID=UPI0019F76EFE|nr:MarR family transcriptional regulator [Jatrophihabitans endophyticus]MBE7190546.1 MarR family transcriptional regulator [Jatrophihabitans endophyticus]
MPVTPEPQHPPVRPDDWRLGVWRSFLRSHATVTAQLEAELADRGLPLSWYDVLLQLVEAPRRRLRMAELADRVLLSRSGLTRLVDRLQAEGYVTRERSPDDARGTYTVLTRSGFEALRAAAPVHLAGVRDHFLRLYTDDELRVLADLLGRIDD